MDVRERRFRLLVALGGLAAVILLGAYFVLPPANATAADVTRVAAQGRNLFFAFAWLQATGSFIAALFLLALVSLTNATRRFSGIVAEVGVAVLLAVALFEGALTIDVAAATANGHPEAALASFDLMGQFVHIFPVVPAPMIFISLGFALVDSAVLPRAFGWLALALRGGFAVVGFAGLFSPLAASAAVLASIVQECWIAAAAVALIVAEPRASPGSAG